MQTITVKMSISQQHMITVVKLTRADTKLLTYNNVTERTDNSTIQIHSKTAEESACLNIDAFLCIVIRQMVINCILV